MTAKLYLRDPYKFEFETTVKAVDGDWVILKETAFFPGGGGQAPDRGTLQGQPVEEVELDGEEVRHLVPGHGLSPGSGVWGTVDWERRYQLMQAHSAEHMLFSALRRQVPDLELVKISIEPERSQVIVRGDLGWDAMVKAQEEVNKDIEANLSIIRSTMPRDEVDPDEVRARLERIEGDEVSLVEIGEDCVACSGLHVMETGEIEALLILGTSSAGKEGLAVNFLVGPPAREESLRLASAALQAAETLGSQPGDLTSSVRNAVERMERQRLALRELTRRSLAEPQLLLEGSLNVRGGIFPMAERGELTDAAERLRSAGDVALLLMVDEGVSALLAAPEGSELDCPTLLREALTPLGGRGGGKKDFAQGGLADGERAEELLESLLDKLRGAMR